MAGRQYLVHCVACDRLFWQDEEAAPVPAHSAWERRAAATHDTGRYCAGSLLAGEWIAEGDGPLSSWPAPSRHPAAGSPPEPQDGRA